MSSMAHKLTVIKRDGSEEPVRVQEIQDRITSLAAGLDALDPADITLQVCAGLRDRMATSELDEYAAQLCSSRSSHDPDYGTLATRLVVSNLHKVTKRRFSKVMHEMYWHYDARQRHCPRITTEMYELIKRVYGHRLDDLLTPENDQLFTYFGMNTLMKSYLMRKNGKIMEQPQHLYMRVALQIHGSDFERLAETYRLLSEHKMIHATPTLFNSCTPNGNLISCFLMGTNDDMEGLYKTIKDAALISKASGGLSVALQNVRPRGSPIYGTGGTSDGIVPLCRVYNYTAMHANQGGGKRNGSFAMYTEPWTPDILEFLTLRLGSGQEGSEKKKGRNLFYALWIPNLFMERYAANGDWSLFDINGCPGLDTTYGAAFDELYTKYEAKGVASDTIKAEKVLKYAMRQQRQQGLPYMLFKDWVNIKSNLRHYMITKSSNLCCEIVEPCDADEYAVCTLASINLKTFILQSKTWDTEWDIADIEQLYDFVELARVAGVLCRNLDNLIDSNKYPVPETRVGSMKHRYIGIGAQGLQDAFFELGLPFWSPRSRMLNRYIAETIYYGAMRESIQLARERGVYPSHPGSPLSEGKFQYHLWQEAHPDYTDSVPNVLPLNPLYAKWDWVQLQKDVLEHGARNSMLIAYMPTQSTSRISGNVAGMEPLHSNMYKESTIAGSFPINNKYLIRDLKQLDLWDDAMRQKIMSHNGSVQQITEIPAGMRGVYKTCFEVKQSGLLRMAADRGPFCCQSQSTNLFLQQCDEKTQSNCLMLAYRLGLKTASYYTHSKAATEADKLSLQQPACAVGAGECESCSG